MKSETQKREERKKEKIIDFFASFIPLNITEFFQGRDRNSLQNESIEFNKKNPSLSRIQRQESIKKGGIHWLISSLKDR